MNRLANCQNRWQGKYKRVLCVCSAGLLRAATAAYVLSQEPYNFNTRAVGVAREFALIPIDEVHLDWADEIVVMTQDQAEKVREMQEEGDDTPIIVLDIPDNYAYRDPELIRLIKDAYTGATGI
jgi:predicted protein tyrosine phosphatase